MISKFLNIVHPIGGNDIGPTSVLSFLDKLKGKILAIKLHPAFIVSMYRKYEFDVIEAVKNQGFLVMIDDKSYDIPVETASFVKMYEDAGADILTVHASGGPRMLDKVMKAANTIQIFGVTLLTSFEDWECKEIYTDNPKETVVRLMKLVENAGCHGSVCAPRDLEWVAEAGIDVHGRDRLCPNIRDPEIPIKGDDQNLNRALTPAEAKAKGVSLMVIGRMLKNADEPGDLADRIQRQFNEKRYISS